MPAGFSLRFLSDAAPFVYDYPTWLANVRRLDRARYVLAIEDCDVEQYEVRGSPSQCASLRLTEEATRRLRAAERTLIENPAIVLLGDELVYAGREYLRYGAAAIRFPVVHRDRLNERVLDVCGALGGVSDEQARVLDRPELRAHFRRTGRLVER
ncbi:MAG: hypothetical protein JNK05_15025 [Myxococcales bacterium]|nr:hypothetical protein [Myxococcales bacterium]